jgi:hypothetical protein
VALSEFERKRFERVVAAFVEERRPPAHLRAKVDLAFRVTGQSVEIFEVRPKLDRPDRIIENAVAKATYVKATARWKVFWQRADLKWHRYEPTPEVGSLEEFLQVVRKDEYSCFFG